jgi:flagellar hook-basal body complex protein FliE
VSLMESIPKIEGLDRINRLDPELSPKELQGHGFSKVLETAIRTVDRLQHESEAAQQAYAQREAVDLHDVLIKIEEAEVAFKTMMEVRNKLVESYNEIMRMGG